MHMQVYKQTYVRACMHNIHTMSYIYTDIHYINTCIYRSYNSISISQIQMIFFCSFAAGWGWSPSDAAVVKRRILCHHGAGWSDIIITSAVL